MTEKAAAPNLPAETKRLGATRSRVVAAILTYLVFHLLLDWLSKVTDERNLISIWYPVAGLVFGLVIYFGRTGALLAFVAICISHIALRDPRIPIPAILLFAFCVTALTYLWRNIFFRLGVARPQLAQTPRWTLALAAMAILTAATNTLCGITQFYFSDVITKASIVPSAIDFLTGDLIGIMSLAPLLALAIFPAYTRWQRGQGPQSWRWQRATLLYLIVGALEVFFIFHSGNKYKLLAAYLGAVPMMYPALRGRVRETCLAIFIMIFSLALGLSIANLDILHEISVFVILAMTIAYIVATANSTSRAILTSLRSTLEERDQLAQDQQKLVEQVAHLQSLESMGTLAGGMAHELNNLLQPILTYARAAESASDTDRATYLERIRTCALNAKTLVQDVLAFSHAGTRTAAETLIITGPADILIRNSVAIVAKTVPPAIPITEDYCADDWQIKCSPPQLSQIMINLFRNALDARTRTIHLSTCYEPKANRVMLTVRDTGLGMDAQTARKALEPFFTTKQIGLGTGLGLSVVYGIVQSWGADLILDSVPGQGTTVAIAFAAIPAEGKSDGNDPAR
jgi:signal transduction histidine kinase